MADKIRHVLIKGDRWFWNPSKTLRTIGMTAEALGTDRSQATLRAIELNNWADGLRDSARSGSNTPAPGSFSLLFSLFKASDDFKDLKPRTQHDYIYYLEKVEEDFGRVRVSTMSAFVISEYYKRIRKQKGVTWAYHIMGPLRAILSFAVTQDWISSNPALNVKVKSPPKRTVTWKPVEREAYIKSATALGWHSIAAMVHVFDSIGQSPIDVRSLPIKAFKSGAIDVTRAKTGVTDAPIQLFPAARKALDAYLKGRTEGPMFVHDKIGGAWNESTLHKTHNLIRIHAKLPSNLQLQDFRRTAQTEAGAAGATADEIRGLARHKTRSAALHYVLPDERYVNSAQRKRLAKRREKSECDS